MAYQQREDVNTICDVERRTCHNGILLGSFEQSSCHNDIVYTYQTPKIISYNKKIINPLIQPDPAPYRDANIDVRGKRDGILILNTRRNNNINSSLQKENPGDGQYDTDGTYCRTPQ
ncbi:MAG: hypothetical protein GXP45_04000 [bacterium]|nr:hypothetical protein [bacterium]